MDLLDPNDVIFAQARASSPIIDGYPCPRGADGTINPHVSRFILTSGQWMDVFHVKPVYYETPEGAWRPLEEVCSYHGNKRIAIRPDRVSWVHPRFLLWLMRRQRLLGSELAFWSPGYAGVQPRHLEFANTLTAYPDPSPETTTVDGRVARISDPDWATAHDTAAGTIAGNAGTDCYIYAQTTGVVIIQRGFFLFNTAALGGSGATISSATASWVAYNSGFSNTDNDGDDWLNVVQSNPASNTAIVTSDYNKCGSAVSNPTEGATRIDLGSITHNDSTYNDFTLDATGRGWISKTGVTKLGVREGHDCINSAVTAANVCGLYCADYTGSTRDPKLVVTYTPPTPVSLSTTTSPVASLGKTPNKQVSFSPEYTSGLTFTASGNYGGYTSLNNGGAGMRDGTGGSGASAFGTTNVNPSWIMVDLGADVPVGYVSMMPNNGTPDGWSTSYFVGSIQWAPNNSGSPGAWTTIGTANGGTYGVYQNFQVNQTCRFIRIYNTSWTALAEFRVYSQAGVRVSLQKAISRALQGTTSPLATIARRLSAYRSLSVNAAAIISLVKRANRILSVNQDPEVSLVRLPSKRLTSTTTPTKSILRAVAKAMSVSVSTVKTIVRQNNKAMAVNAAAEPTLLQTLFKALQVETTPETLIQRAMDKGMQVTTAPVASVNRELLWALEASTSPSVSIQRMVATAISVTTDPDVTIGLQISKALQVTTAPVVSLMPSVVFFLTLQAQATAEAVIQRAVSKIMGVETAPTASIVLLVGIQLSALADHTLSMQRDIAKFMQVETSPEAVIVRVASFFRELQAVAEVVATIAKRMPQGMQVEVASQVDITKEALVSLQAEAASTSSIQSDRLVNVFLDAQVAVEVLIVRAMQLALGVEQQPETSIAKFMSKALGVEVATMIGMVKEVNKPLQAVTAPSVTLYRQTLFHIVLGVVTAPVVGILRAIAYGLQVTVAPEVSLKRDMTKAMGVETQPLPTLVQLVAKAMNVTTQPAASMVRQVNKPLNVETQPVVSLAKQRLFQRILQVLTAPLASMRRDMTHSLQVAQDPEVSITKQSTHTLQTEAGVVASVQRVVRYGLNVQLPVIPSLVKQVGKLLGVNVESASDIGKTANIGLNVETQPQPSIARFLMKNMQAVAESTSSIGKQVGVGLQALATSTSTISRNIFKSFGVAVASVPRVYSQITSGVKRRIVIWYRTFIRDEDYDPE